MKNKKVDYYFGGVYSKDLLPKDLIMKKFYIFILQDNDAGSGSHWCVFYYNNSSTSICFDSYGFSGPIEVEQRIKPNIYLVRNTNYFILFKINDNFWNACIVL